ncbi:MAG: hypothetical protein AAF192_03905 [Pseudomonadota bacterium]
MTFFLKPRDPGAVRPRAARPAPAPPASFGDVAGAAFEAETVETDAWMQQQRAREDIFSDIEARLGRSPPLTRRGLRKTRVYRNEVLAEAAERALKDPGSWADLPLTQEGIDAAAAEQLRARWEDAQDVLAMGQDYAGVADFGGRMARAMTDEAGIVTGIAGMGVGSAGSLTLRGAARTVGIEALLGAGGEALTLPGQFRAAEALGLPDPEVIKQLALGGLAGGAFAAVPLGVRGGIYAFRRKRPDGAPEGVDPREVEATLAADADGAARGEDFRPRPVFTGVEGAVRKIIGVESGGNPNARNPMPGQTAAGLGQFIDATWLATVRKHRPDLAARLSERELLALKTDPELGYEMTVAHVGDNAEHLAANGYPVTDANLYLAHFAGPSGAVRALGMDPEAPISALFSPKEIAANSIATYAGRPLPQWTIGDLRRWTEAKMGASVDPGDAFAASTRRGFTLPDQVTTPGGMRVGVDYEVVDLSDLTFASGGRQPRDRARPVSDAWVARTAAELDPAQLMPSPIAAQGAPVVGPDGVVDSGNGRVMAIARAYDRHPDRASVYREAVGAVAPIPDGVTRPVLIARRRDALDEDALRRFVVEAQDSGVARLSATERAAADADLLDERLLGLYEPDAPLDGAGNQRFLSGFVDRVPRADQGELVTGDGRLSQQGLGRVRAALMSRAYGDDGLTAAATEAGGAGVRSLLDAMTDAAPAWWRMREATAAGDLGDVWDITPQVGQAVRLVQEARDQARREGVSVAAAIDGALRQRDMLVGDVDPIVARLLSVFYRGSQARARDDVADALRRYADEAGRVGQGADLLSDVAPVGPLDVLDRLAGSLAEVDAARSGARAAEAPQPAASHAVALDLRGGGTGEAFDAGAASPGAEAAASQGAADLRVVAEASAAPPLSPAQMVKRQRDLKDAQPFETVDELFSRAPDAQRRLGEIGSRIADRLGIDWLDPGMKDRARADEKMVRKAYATPRELTDIVRASFVVDRAEQADAALRAFEADGIDVLDEGWNVNSVGYADRKFLLVLDDGLLAEVQVLERRMAAAKKQGHRLYRQARSSSDPAEIAELSAQQREIYSAAAREADPTFASIFDTSSGPNSGSNAPRQSSSGQAAPVSATSSASTDDQLSPGASTANADVGASNTAGRPSQFTNVTGSPSLDTPDVGVDAGSGNDLRDLSASQLQEIIIEIDADGNPVSSLADELRALDDDAEFAEAIQLCSPERST